jgi:hypothetical protein
MAERSIANEIKHILNAEKRQAKAEKNNDNLVLGSKYMSAMQHYKWDKQAKKDQQESAQLYDTLFGQRNRNMAEYDRLLAKQQQELAPLRLKTIKHITLKAKGRSIRRETRRKNNTKRQAKQRTSLLQKRRTLSRTASPPLSPSLAASPQSPSLRSPSRRSSSSRSPRSRSPSRRSSSSRSPRSRSPRSRSPSRQRSQSRKSKANSV